jgi:hypothetical protein
MMTVWSCRSESGVCMMRKKVRLYCRKRLMRNLRSILNLQRHTIEHVAPQSLKESGACQSASTHHTKYITSGVDIWACSCRVFMWPSHHARAPIVLRRYLTTSASLTRQRDRCLGSFSSLHQQIRSSSDFL